MKKYFLFFCALSCIFLWGKSSQAITTSYSFVGELSYNSSGSGGDALLSFIDQKVFGTFTGTLVYDSEGHNYVGDKIVDYFDGKNHYNVKLYEIWTIPGSISITLANGSTIVDNQLITHVFAESPDPLMHTGTGFSIGSGFMLPSDFWSSTPSSDFFPKFPYIGCKLHFEDANPSVFDPPPSSLNLSFFDPRTYNDYIVYDDNHNGLFSFDNEALWLNSTISSVNVVPLPSAVLLLGSGLLGLAGWRRFRKS
jgi:hypothetical protein